MLSWSATHPGARTSARVVWLEVRNEDLTPDTDPIALAISRLQNPAQTNCVALITSRDIRRHHLAQACIEDETATCVTTVGLSNGERVGTRCSEPVLVPGTINTLVHVARPLSEAAYLETLAIVVQARTAAVIESGELRGGVAITGTGTDCVVIAAPPGKTGARYAGMHTAIGEAVGAATYQATRDGIAIWRRDFDAYLASSGALYAGAHK